MVTPLSKRLRKPTVQDRFLRMVVYGPNRSGKSVFAGSAAEILPTLFLECSEGGSDSLVGFPYKPDVLHVNEIKDLNGIFWGIREGSLVSSDGEGPFKVVVFDDVGELAKRAMDAVMKIFPRDVPQDFMGIEKFPQRREWGITTEQMRKVIRYFNDLPVHLIWTAQDRMFINSESGAVMRIGPDLNPALSSDVVNYSKIIGYMYNKTDKEGVLRRLLIIGPAELNNIPLVTGQRMGLREEEVTYFVDPTFRDVFDVILTERESELVAVEEQPIQKRVLARGKG